MNVTGMDENCHLFNPEREPMTDYLGSCNIVMGPLFDNADNQLTDCSKDDCGGYVESECAKKGIEVDTADTPLPNADACQLVMISRASANALTYYTYDVRAKVCKGYGDGARACDNQVALQTMDEALINSCQT